MKKVFFLLPILILASIAPRICFSEDSKSENSRVLAQEEKSLSSAGKMAGDVFPFAPSGDPRPAAGKEPSPIPAPAAIAVVKPDGKAVSGTPAQAPSAVVPETAAPRTFPEATDAEMKQRWDALFSKEITPGSISYEVKSGDSLYLLAIKNHTTASFIKKLNGMTRDVIYPGMKLKIQTAPFSILIDKTKNTLTLYSDGKPIKKYIVATGKKNSTPAGEFKITNKLANPTWFKTGAILPPGSPKNALGTRWMGFDKPGYGIHGTIDPKSIGTQSSEGCIRMLNEEVEELYRMVPSGAQVTVKD